VVFCASAGRIARGPPDKGVQADGQDKSSGPGRAAARAPATGASFDFYLLALSAHAAFCADGHEDTSECRSAAHRPLVIHGLWPERLEPRAYPHDCPAPALDLDAGLEQQLADFMPGMAAGLHEHEWREHGGCSGLDDDVYFERTLELARTLDAALGARLTTLAGRDTSAAELRETADMFQPGIGATIHAALSHAARRGRSPGAGRSPPVHRQRRCRRCSRHIARLRHGRAARPGLRRRLSHCGSHRRPNCRNGLMSQVQALIVAYMVSAPA
jgi:ribonuclease I